LRRRAQIVFQNPDSSLNPKRTIEEIIRRPLVLHGLARGSEARKRVLSLLDMVRLPAGFAGRYPHQLSGGEKQRVGIARALATSPDFLVCDEAVSALDVSVQAAILNLLAELRRELRLSLLFISHDLAVVSHIADRIAVMYRGMVLQMGDADEVLRHPYHPYTRALLAAVPSIERAVDRSAALVPIEEAGAKGVAGCPFFARCPHRRFGTCDEKPPPMVRLGPENTVRCHLEPSQLAERQPAHLALGESA
jgi:peptide/nickel transport system ATP-binding protein